VSCRVAGSDAGRRHRDTVGPVCLQRRVRRGAADLVRTSRVRTGEAENQRVEQAGRPDHERCVGVATYTLLSVN